jgi:hypothetical protein
MGKHHQCILADARVFVTQPVGKRKQVTRRALHGIQLRGPGLDNVGEAEGKVAHAYNGVGPDDGR